MINLTPIVIRRITHILTCFKTAPTLLQLLQTAGKLPFVFILRRRPKRLWRERWKTFISLRRRDAVSGPYKNFTPATLRRVQIVFVVPLAAFPRAISVERRLRSRSNVLKNYQDYFDIPDDFDTFPLC